MYGQQARVQLLDRERVTVLESSEHSDNVTTNFLTILADLRASIALVDSGGVGLLEFGTCRWIRGRRSFLGWPRASRSAVRASHSRSTSDGASTRTAPGPQGGNCHVKSACHACAPSRPFLSV